MKSWIPRITAFLLAVLATTALASLAHSIFVQRALEDVGAVIPLGSSLSAIGRDFVGLLPSLGLVVAGTLLIAFSVAGLIKPLVRPIAPFAYPLAGWAGMALALFAMRTFYGFSPLAGARTPAGFLLMSLAGLVGGIIFAALRKRRLFARP